jgi:hypothetical protein
MDLYVMISILIFVEAATQQELYTLDLWCWKKDCPNYGKKGLENIVFKERYGKMNAALFGRDFGSEGRILNRPICGSVSGPSWALRSRETNRKK